MWFLCFEWAGGSLVFVLGVVGFLLLLGSVAFVLRLMFGWF